MKKKYQRCKRRPMSSNKLYKIKSILFLIQNNENHFINYVKIELLWQKTKEPIFCYLAVLRYERMIIVWQSFYTMNVQQNVDVFFFRVLSALQQIRFIIIKYIVWSKDADTLGK